MSDRKRSLNVILFLGLIVSIFIGLRSSKVGKDTIIYIKHFYNAKSGKYLDKFEPGFSYLIYFISKYTNSFSFFFFIIATLITLCYLLFFDKIYTKTFNLNSSTFGRYIIFYTIVLFSSWYYALTTNGIRQGVSLVFLYISMYYLYYENRKFKFLFFYLLAILFHNSSLMIAPFILFYKLRFRLAFFIWIILAIGYFLDINKLLIEFISSKFNLPVYQFVLYYSVDRDSLIINGLYQGFILNFFLYTIFWPLLLLAITFWNSEQKFYYVNKNEILILIKIYFFLSYPYFLLGFGPFSNRYAVLCWFLIPIIQFHIIFSIFYKNSFSKIAFPILIVGILYFILINLEMFKYLYE